MALEGSRKYSQLAWCMEQQAAAVREKQRHQVQEAGETQQQVRIAVAVRGTAAPATPSKRQRHSRAALRAATALTAHRLLYTGGAACTGQH